MIKYIVKNFFIPDSNSYVVYDDETKNCLIIDLGGDFCEVEKIIKQHNLNLKGILLTHAHYDHIAGAIGCVERGIDVYISTGDAQKLSNSDNLHRLFGEPPISVSYTATLSEGKTTIGGIEFEVIETPGHTSGSLCFLFGNLLFSGDTLFCGSFGRYDFPSGDFNLLKKSINEKLFTLSDDIKVLPGHEEPTTIEHEKISNPINRL